MNVTPESVVTLVRETLAPRVRADEARFQLALDFANEIVVYGAGVFPRELFAKPSGRDLAAMVCEDAEGALLVDEMLARRADDARVVEISRGYGLLTLMLSVLHPERRFEMVEPDRQRQWFLKRMRTLLRLRKLTVHEGTEQEFAAENAGSVDLALIKRMAPVPALDFAVPLITPAGRVLSWQDGDRSAEVRHPRAHPDGWPVRLESSIPMESGAARGRSILCVGSAAELDASVPAA